MDAPTDFGLSIGSIMLGATAPAPSMVEKVSHSALDVVMECAVVRVHPFALLHDLLAPQRVRFLWRAGPPTVFEASRLAVLF